MRRRTTKATLTVALLGLTLAAAACGGHASASVAGHDSAPIGPPYNPRADSLRLVAFPDARHGWAVGDTYDVTGIGIQATTNGGLDWAEQKSGDWGSTWGPYGVAFANAACGWVLTATDMDINGHYPDGDANTILATTDGGATWNSQHSGTGIELWDIASAGASHAWAVGADPSDSGTKNIIIATSDGGTRWTKQYSATTVNTVGRSGLEAVAFADTAHGWAVGSDGLILATTDGGATWKKQAAPTSDGLEDVVCVDATHAWALGDEDNDDILLATTDGGATWKVQHTWKMWIAGVNSAGLCRHQPRLGGRRRRCHPRHHRRRRQLDAAAFGHEDGPGRRRLRRCDARPGSRKQVRGRRPVLGHVQGQHHPAHHGRRRDLEPLSFAGVSRCGPARRARRASVQPGCTPLADGVS